MPMTSTATLRTGIANWRERWFAGLTWKGVAIVFLFCVLNSVRGAINQVPISNASWGLLFYSVATTSLIMMAAALPIVLAVVATLNRFPVPGRRQYTALAAAVLWFTGFGVILYLTLGAQTPYGYGWRLFGLSFIQVLVRYGTLAGLFAAAYAWYRNESRSAAALRASELAQTQLDAQMDEARLQMLQAQIEPHFLFNTLANVRRLYQTEPNAADSMLNNLMRYLAVALPQMRESESTLGREATLAEAYLNIQKIRMGRRLAFAIDVPEALRTARLPPMMLLTLVENAIKHGSGPLPEGGFVRIAARAGAGQLEVEVADTGQGFAKKSGVGTGLANIRARLAAMYGAGGRLAMALNRPQGVTMTLALPHAAAVAGEAR